MLLRSATTESAVMFSSKVDAEIERSVGAPLLITSIVSGNIERLKVASSGMLIVFRSGLSLNA